MTARTAVHIATALGSVTRLAISKIFSKPRLILGLSRKVPYAGAFERGLSACCFSLAYTQADKPSASQTRHNRPNPELPARERVKPSAAQTNPPFPP